MADKDIKLIIETVLKDQKFRQAMRKMSREVAGTTKKQESFISKAKAKWLELGAAAAAAAVTIKKAFDFTREFAKFEQTATATTRIFGQNAEEIISKLSRAAGGAISDTNLLLAANRSATLGVTKNLDEMARLLEFARVRGRALGVDTTQAFNDIVTGIGRGSPLILDNLGIITKGWDKEAKAAGKAMDAQFVLNKVLQQAGKELKKTGPLAQNNAEKFESLGAKFDNFRVAIGKALAPLIIPMVDAFSKLLQLVIKLPDSIKAFGAVLAGLGPAAIAAGIAFGAMGAKIILLVGAVAAIVINVKRLIKGIEELVTATDTAKRSQEDWNKQMANQRAVIDASKSVKTYKEELKGWTQELKEATSATKKDADRINFARTMRARFNKLVKESIAQEKKARKANARQAAVFKRLNKLGKDSVDVNIKVSDSLKKLLDQRKKNNKAAEDEDKKRKERLALVQQIADLEFDLMEDGIEKQQEALRRQQQENNALILEAAKKRAITEKEADDLILQNSMVFANKRTEIEKKAADKAAKIARDKAFKVVDFLVDLQKNFFDIVASLSKASSQKALDALQAEKEQALETENEFRNQLTLLDEQDERNKMDMLRREISAARAAGDEETANEKEQQLRRIELEEKAAAEDLRIQEEFAAKEREIKRKQAVAERAAALFQIAVDTAVAIAKSLTGAPFPANLVLAAGSAAAGIAQGIAVANEPLPAFADGGFSSGGDAIVGEIGPEKVNLPAGSEVISNAVLRGIELGGGAASNNVTNTSTQNDFGGNNINITISNPDPAAVADELSNYFDDLGVRFAAR
jgi:hypothetical protein